MKTQAWLESRVEQVWLELAELGHPRLLRIDPPKVKINNRFTRTAGRSWNQRGFIELGGKFLEQFPIEMVKVILPHEVIHYADWHLFGPSDKRCGHGTNWQMLMVQYGLKPNKYHCMDLEGTK